MNQTIRKKVMLSEQKLLEMYPVYAHFYTLHDPDSHGRRWEKPCRSALEIIAKEKQSKKRGEDSVDAIFIMMNPGSSEPIPEGSGECESISVDKISSMPMKKDLVPTFPDKTQYQVMRVMNDKNWKHVLVINLSDIRNANSNGRAKKDSKGLGKKESFAVEYKAIEKQNGEAHSIFCEDRQEELERQFSRVGAGPIVLAWGVGSYLSPLIERARRSSLSRRNRTGWRKKPENDRFWKYYHPLPRTLSGQNDWRKNFLGNES